MWIHVHDVYMCMCVCLDELQQVFKEQLRVLKMRDLHVYVCICICIYVYVDICICVHVDICI